MELTDAMKVHFTTAYPREGSYLTLFQELAARDRIAIHSVVEDPAEADIILFVDARSDHNDWRLDAIRRHPLVSAYREKAFLYNEMDQPWCALPGLYVSMPRRFFNRRRQRACSYVVRVNPYVEAIGSEVAEPDLLFSFMGRRCHWIRDRIFDLSHPRAYIQDTSCYNFFGGADVDLEVQKRHYAEVMRRSKFVLCPRGAGPASFRVFETMAAGRVPVVISDAWIAPSGPDWDTCTLWLREAEVDEIPVILEASEHRFAEMAAAARQGWEEWFAPEVLFHRMVESCGEILEDRRLPEAVWQRLPDSRLLHLYARSVARQLRDALRK